MPFKKKTFRHKLESRLDDLTSQTEDLRKQVVERAPEVKASLIDLLPDKSQLLELRDDLFDRLPDNVQDKLPEKAKPKRRRLRKVAAVGALTGAGAAAFAILRNRGAAPVRPIPEPVRTPAKPAQDLAEVVDPSQASTTSNVAEDSSDKKS